MPKRETAAAEIKKVIGSAFVYASREKEILEAPSVVAGLQKKEYASFGCSDCGTSMIAEASMEPLCVTCGSHQVKKTAEKAALNVKADSELSAVICHTCKNFNVVQLALVKAASKKIHCSACGSNLDIMAELAPANPNEPMKLGDANADQDDDLKRIEPPETKASATNVENAPTPSNSEPSVLNDTGTAPELKTPETSSNVDDMADNDYSDGKEEAEAMLDSGESEDDGSEDSDDEEVRAFFSKSSKKFMTSADFGALDEPMSLEADDGLADVGVLDDTSLPYEVDVGDPIMDSLMIDDGDDVLSFTQVANRLVAMKGHVAVATLKKADAKANADIMYEAAFHKAVAYSAKSKGLRASLDAFGFKPLRIKAMTQAAVNAEKAKMLQEAKAEREAFMKKFEQSLAIAAAGFARNTWKDRPNILQEAFVRELQTLGMRNPKPMVARVFQTAGIPFTKDLLAHADVLMSKSHEARAALVDILAITQETAEDMVENSDDMGDEFDNVTSHAEAASIVRRTVPSNKHSVSASDVLSGRVALTFEAGL
jgi:DNA-directed RNA polymerase subunit M/transcription elongation factor TFIIS